MRKNIVLYTKDIMGHRITKMPGTACTYFLFGRCLYAEAINPGLDTDNQCRSVTTWVDAYDSFLEQIENFRMSEETAARIWSQRLTKLLERGPGCSLFEPQPSCCKSGGGCGGSCGSKDDDQNEDGAADTSISDALAQMEKEFSCLHFFQGVCVKALPECDGVCGRFELTRKKDDV